MKDITTFAVKAVIAGLIAISIYYYISPQQNCIREHERNVERFIGLGDDYDETMRNLRKHPNFRDISPKDQCEEEHSW